MKKLFLLALSLTFFSHAQAAVQEIDVSSMAFNPNVIDINQGDTVRWINRDAVPHKIQGDFATSPNLGLDDRFEFMFNQAGNFDYICALHPSMTGTIRVAAVTEIIENEEEGAVNFSDLFGTGESFEPNNLATVNQPFETDAPAEPLETLNVTTPAPPTETVAATPPPVATATFNTSAPERSVAKATNQSLPTAGGDNWYVYLGVLLFLGGFFWLSAASRR